MRQFVDYYQVLNVSPDSDQAGLRRAYLLLAKKYHPDVGGPAAEMKLVNEAYRTLRDPQAKAAYDERYRQQVSWKRGGQDDDFEDIDDLFNEVIRETKLKKAAEAEAQKATVKQIIVLAAALVVLIAGGIMIARIIHRSSEKNAPATAQQ